MSNGRITFSALCKILSDLGFQKAAVKEPFIGFRHPASDTLIVLPPYRNKELVAPHHVAQVRVELDANGLMDGADFDRLVGQIPTRHPASS